MDVYVRTASGGLITPVFFYLIWLKFWFKKFEKAVVFESSVLAWIQIRIKQKCWIRIRIKSIRIHNPAVCINNVVEIFLKDSAVSMRLPKPLPRSIWDRGSGFGGLYETAEAASAVSIRPRKPYISNDYLDFLGEFEAI
jgi:hypothetical protein